MSTLYNLKVKPIDITKTSIMVEILLQYVFLAQDATVYVYFKDAENAPLDVKTVYIPPEIYAAWTDSDEYLVDYILSELGLTRV